MKLTIYVGCLTFLIFLRSIACAGSMPFYDSLVYKATRASNDFVFCLDSPLPNIPTNRSGSIDFWVRLRNNDLQN